MRCPKCGHTDSKVIDSRPSENQEAIRRRRECTQCEHRFTTYERRDESPLLIVKKNGSKEIFNREKLLRGLETATVKRDINIEQLNNLITDIELSLKDQGIFEIPSTKLGEMVLLKLKDIDKVAYVRFASVYRDFKDIDEFNEELRSLSNGSDR